MSIHIWFDLLWCLLIFEYKFAAARPSFPGFPWTSGTITDCPIHDSTKSIPVVLPAGTGMLGWKGTNLKGKKMTNKKGTYIFYYWLSLGSFGYALVQRKSGLDDGVASPYGEMVNVVGSRLGRTCQRTVLIVLVLNMMLPVEANLCPFWVVWGTCAS
jgi:hypothetical protein